MTKIHVNHFNPIMPGLSNMFKSLLTLFCFHLFLLYGQQDYEMDTRIILDTPIMISLDRYLERYDETCQLMQQAGFTNILRFSAIDGHFTDDDFFQKLNIHKNLLPGQKGCAASHLLLWEKFLKDDSDRDFLFVSEDDMLPHSNFSILFPLFWKAVPRDFDIFLIGCEFVYKISEEQKENIIVTIPSQNTHAYIISKKSQIMRKIDIIFEGHGGRLRF